MKMFISHSKSKRELINQIKEKHRRVKDDYTSLTNQIKEKEKNILNLIKKVNFTDKNLDLIVKNIK